MFQLVLFFLTKKFKNFSYCTKITKNTTNNLTVKNKQTNQTVGKKYFPQLSQ